MMLKIKSLNVVYLKTFWPRLELENRKSPVLLLWRTCYGCVLVKTIMLMLTRKRRRLVCLFFWVRMKIKPTRWPPVSLLSWLNQTLFSLQETDLPTLIHKQQTDLVPPLTHEEPEPTLNLEFTGCILELPRVTINDVRRIIRLFSKYSTIKM